MASTASNPTSLPHDTHSPDSHSHSNHHLHKPMHHTDGTPPRLVELPPPAWGSPAHLAARRAEKEWTQHLRAHASADAAARKVGKHARYVDTVDVVVRYTLPPDWSLAVDGASTGVVVKEGDAVWELPESDEVLVAVLKASSQPFFQRTGEFSKTSAAFKTPPLAKPAVPKSTPAPAESAEVHPLSHVSTPSPAAAAAIPPPPPSIPVPVADSPKPYVAGSSNNNNNSSSSNAVQPRNTFLPIAIISGMFYRIGSLFLWLIPAPLRARLNAWWSPVLRAPPPGQGHV